MFKSLLKAAVGVAVDLPVSIIKDTVTIGGTLSDDGESAIVKSCKADFEECRRICATLERVYNLGVAAEGKRIAKVINSSIYKS